MSIENEPLDHKKMCVEAANALLAIFDRYDLDDDQVLATLCATMCTFMAATNTTMSEANLFLQNIGVHYKEFLQDLENEPEE
jgi:allophanate hydrolase subunit 1